MGEEKAGQRKGRKKKEKGKTGPCVVNTIAIFTSKGKKEERNLQRKLFFLLDKKYCYLPFIPYFSPKQEEVSYGCRILLNKELLTTLLIILLE